MSGVISFLIFAGLFFVMMRFGCGAHSSHGGHGGDAGHEGVHGGSPPGALGAGVDPVCAMRVDAGMGYAKMHRGAPYRFCSRDCLEKFEADPDKYLKSTQASSSMGHDHPEHGS